MLFQSPCIYHISQIVEIANVATLAIGVTAGLGRRRHLLEERDVARSREALIASFSLTFLTESLSAMSFVYLLRSLNPDLAYHRAMAGLSYLIIAWSIAGIVRFSVSHIAAVPQPTVRQIFDIRESD